MRIRPRSPRPLALWRVVAAAMAMSAGVAGAAPDNGEPLMTLLAEKGLFFPAATPVPVQPAVPAAAPTSGAATTEPDLMRRVQDRASDMVVAAMNFIGVRYRRGGDSAETGFDCSGFTRHVFALSMGLALPRRADEQAAMPGLVKVEKNDLKPGDLVFFNTMRRTFSHVGIYIGDNRFVHAPSHGKDVRTDDMTFAYWAKRFTGARRAELPAGTQAALVRPAEPAAN